MSVTLKDVQLRRQILKADDPDHHGNRPPPLAREAQAASLGGRLYVEVAQESSLRSHSPALDADVGHSGSQAAPQRCRAPNASSSISTLKKNLDRNLSLAELAGVVQLSVFHFTRKFRTEFGCPPHAYVMRKRIERAKTQLARGQRSAQGRCGQQWLLGPKPYDASVPTPARRHAS